MKHALSFVGGVLLTLLLVALLYPEPKAGNGHNNSRTMCMRKWQKPRTTQVRNS